MTSRSTHIIKGVLLPRFFSGLVSVALALGFFPQASAVTPVESGFPDSFVEFYKDEYGSFEDTGGKGKGQELGGFGGLKRKTRAENEGALGNVRPVILLHGNGVDALQSEELRIVNFIPFHIPTLGVWPIRDFLVEKMGYNDAQIWAVSYLGSDPPPTVMATGPVVRNNITDVRRFIDAVIDYLGVEKVDIIAHSLGNNMAKGYMGGFQPDNTWDNSDHRHHKVGTYISISGGHYGVFPFVSPGGDDTGSEFEKGVHEFNGVMDDTPYGPLANGQKSDNPDWIAHTSLDEEAASGAADKITYVAIRSKYDFVDALTNDSSRLVGADLNYEFDLTWPWTIDMLNLVEHSRIITEEAVFDLYKDCLNGGACQAVRRVGRFPHVSRLGAFEKRLRYSAKLLCGLQKEPGDIRLARGSYATAINVLNVGMVPAHFSKRLVLTYPPGDQMPGEVIPISEDRLGPGQALEVDCMDIWHRLFPYGLPTSYIKGFVVIESDADLDVTAVYTTASLDDRGKATQHSGIDVELIRGRAIEARTEGNPEE